jgi:hypothetical protein
MLHRSFPSPVSVSLTYAMKNQNDRSMQICTHNNPKTESTRSIERSILLKTTSIYLYLYSPAIFFAAISAIP